MNKNTQDQKGSAEVPAMPQVPPQAGQGQPNPMQNQSQQVQVNAQAMIETLTRQRDRALNDAAIWESKTTELLQIVAQLTAQPTETSTGIGGPVEEVQDPTETSTVLSAVPDQDEPSS